MLTAQPHLLEQQAINSVVRKDLASDKMAIAFIGLAMSYLLLGLTFGVLGGFQYVLPKFLQEHLAFQKIRPLHVYLATSWIFTAAQGCIYYFLPRMAKRELYWQQGIKWHLLLQILASSVIVIAFFGGNFGGREYLEFPPWMGALIAASWIPFAINFFATLRPAYKNAPVYYFSWTIGICFFFITLSESYLWLLDYFNNNQVRDTTVQWKALGSMVGSWNMLVYGTSMYLMEKIKGQNKMNHSKMAFFFFFLGFTNLLFNWGHHTYIVPAAPWVKTVAYIISMTELLIFGQLVFKFRRTLSEARKNFHAIPFRLLSFADLWIFLNLGAAIAISVPAINYYTHGTHITVAHAMGTTIGINTMLLFAIIFYILEKRATITNRKIINRGIWITNISLLVFWTALIGSGLVKISAGLQGKSFAQMMKACEPFFKLFLGSGIFVLLGLCMMVFAAFALIRKNTTTNKNQSNAFAKPFHIN